MFAFKNFQRSDLARASLVDGLILAYQPGMGKTLMGIAWALLKVGFHTEARGKLLPSKPVLIIAPGGLRLQMIDDYRVLFGDAMPPVTHISSQSVFVSLLASNGGHLAPGWYFSSYEEMALNKFQILPAIQDGPMADNEIRACTNFFGVAAKTPAEGLEVCRKIARETAIGIGETRHGIQCVYRPALAVLMRDHFEAILIDEAVRMKAEDSIIGLGVRVLAPRYRLVLTGTPIKNRLPDIFFLAAWAADALKKPNDRWPYSADTCTEFAREFQALSFNRTMHQRALESPGRTSLNNKPSASLGIPIAEISNTYKLWRTLAPVVLRRRKSDISEQEIQPKIHKTIVVPFGVEQARSYQQILKTPQYDRRGAPAIGAMIAALRTCAASPSAESLGPARSSQPFTPKLHACLEVIRAVLRRREQVVIFSPFHEPLDVLSRFLVESGVPHDVLDGRMSATKRGQLAANFKRGLPSANPVLLAGIKACSEGYSFHLANNVIMFGLDWALDLLRQSEDRVHRINSPKPVNVYSIVVAGSIERKLQSMLEEKGIAADIALDGAPGALSTDEMKLSDLLETATSEFNTMGLIDETKSFEVWPALRRSISDAWTSQQIQIPKAA